MNNRQAWRYLPCYLLPLVPAIGLFGLCLHVMFSRLFYPYALEWIEGGMLQPVVRILQGLPLYTAPDMEYVPPLYAPLYFYLAAGLAYLTDAGLPALRLVSLLAASLTASLVALSVWRLSRSIPAALLALFCWGAVYRFSGYWYDVGRVDSLWALWLLAAVASLVYFRQVGRPLFLWMALPALVLAVLTKQTSLMLLPFYLLLS